ncbi:GH39 family glycosyl hydrolase [Granulicella tundricola]|uniref:Glycoside hydrolase family 39 n=1 Tax=Granulicella tundricola (strain ATCC BAA-1859 / DSM 23138 / MP5ACTX9) TaxID=1198114 RepID=E8X479_GRATM|nr:glycosyl hydrolase family 39 [Granulicella tundricola]ADW67139.1 glycoside hydrolase family 39 [Granulicella tundricola MP5ACTX9]
MRQFWLKGLLLGAAACATGVGHAQETVVVDAHAAAKPFPHFWEQMFGSGRAILTLRESYRDDVKAVKKVADFKYVRFHAIFHDEVGVYNEDEHGNPVYNFAYVDAIYDGLLKNGVKPMVEISFMPKKLAFPDALHPFWYKQNVSPPKSMEKWDGLIHAFTQHLIDRYGVDEVASWYFEVWNEPNIDFWNGIPRLESYFELYDHTARDIKAVNPRLRVGGPATAAAQWVPEFLAHVAENHVPIDFVTTHGYGDDTVENMFNTHEKIAVDDRVGRAVAKVRGEINKSPLPKLPLYWTEWNVPGLMQSRDTTYVGPALANTVREADGNVDMLSFWTFSDVFEEGGPTTTPFRGDFGLRAFDGINKPSYYAYGLLHELGPQRIANKSDNVIVTKDADGGLALVAWNLVDPDQHGSDRTMELEFKGVAKDAKVTIERVDNEHGNVLPKWAAMGKPLNPTPTQATQLNEETAMPAPEQTTLVNGRLKLELEQNALVLVKVAR